MPKEYIIEGIANQMKKNKTSIIASIEARMGSTRLPGKTLRPIIGKPMLQLMVERVKRAKFLNGIVIATSKNIIDDPLEKLADQLGVGCFRGSEEDVLDRVLQAAKCHGADHIVELWGDTTLIDPEIIDQTINYYMENNYDLVGTCLDKTFPWGMSLLVFSTKTLNEISLTTSDPIDRENVSNFIYEHPERYKIGHLPCPPELKRPELRLVVDELPDFELISKIFEYFASIGKMDFSIKEIIELLDERPELKEINNKVKQRVVDKGKQNV